MAIVIRGWRMVAPGRLQSFEKPAEPPGPGRVLVRVAGCGVCHTDLGYLYDGVPTRHDLPLTLGHEIAGVVIETGAGAESWWGRRVLVPAVWPCGTCRACRSGRATACRASVMPGNDADGGFATHVEVPAAPLCPVDPGPVPEEVAIGTAGLALWEIAPVADAVTTPLQSIRRCGLKAGELAVVIGAGGVGIFGVQLAKAEGAVVAAIDVSEERRERAKKLGAAIALDPSRGAKEIKATLRELCATRELPTEGWRVFEMSGHPAGQELAWALLTAGGSIGVVGYQPNPVSVRVSNLMAFDATAYGNWGCDPALYPEALARVTSGAVKVRGLVRKMPLDDAPAALEAVHRGELKERVVLVP